MNKLHTWKIKCNLFWQPQHEIVNKWANCRLTVVLVLGVHVKREFQDKRKLMSLALILGSASRREFHFTCRIRNDREGKTQHTYTLGLICPESRKRTKRIATRLQSGTSNQESAHHLVLFSLAFIFLRVFLRFTNSSCRAVKAWLYECE